jgi:hypothetical protein
VRLRRLAAILAILSLAIGPGGGCLSLSMLNRENGDTRLRLDSLEQRVSALETGGVHPAAAPPRGVPPAATVPQQIPQSTPFDAPNGRG